MTRPLLAGCTTIALVAALWASQPAPPGAPQPAAAPVASAQPNTPPPAARAVQRPPPEGKDHRPAIHTVLPPPADDAPAKAAPQAAEDADYAAEGFESLEELRAFVSEALGVPPEQLTLRSEVRHGTRGTRILISEQTD